MIVTTSLIATKLTHQRRPERAHLLERKKIQAPLAHGGGHHDELAPRIDVDPLPLRAPEHEHPALAREDARMVAVPLARHGPAAPLIPLDHVDRGCLQTPGGRDDLPSAAVA